MDVTDSLPNSHNKYVPAHAVSHIPKLTACSLSLQRTRRPTALPPFLLVTPKNISSTSAGQRQPQHTAGVSVSKRDGGIAA